jgi:hypothetical protein
MRPRALVALRTSPLMSLCTERSDLGLNETKKGWDKTVTIKHCYQHLGQEYFGRSVSS